MTDNEKRAHDLAIACIPHAIEEADWDCYKYGHDDVGYVNTDIVETYLELYGVFLEEFKDAF